MAIARGRLQPITQGGSKSRTHALVGKCSLSTKTRASNSLEVTCSLSTKPGAEAGRMAWLANAGYQPTQEQATASWALAAYQTNQEQKETDGLVDKCSLSTKTGEEGERTAWLANAV